MTELEAYQFLFPGKTEEDFETFKADPNNAVDYQTVKDTQKNSEASEQIETPPPE